MKTDIAKLIAKLATAKKSYSAIAVTLVTLDHAKDRKEAEALLTDAGIDKPVKGESVIGFNGLLRLALIDNPYLTDEEIAAILSEHGTDVQRRIPMPSNTKNYIKDLRTLARGVADSLK